MYAYIKGIITDRNDQQIVIENNGIGYLINCPLGISAELGGLGEEIKVYLYQSVKEDDISLYGFSSRDQKEMFLKLITVSGIGPKVAHSICSQLTPDKFALAVMGSDVKALTGVKGLGKKGAERIVLELKDKLKKAGVGGGASSKASSKSASASASPVSGIASDAIEALVVLGYKELVAAEAVGNCYNDGIDLQTLIRNSLKSLAR
jgi:Holliday junction DNA helicase RuvA